MEHDNGITERDGKYYVDVEIPSNEEPDIEHPTTFGTSEEVGPFNTLEQAKTFLATKTLPADFKQGS